MMTTASFRSLVARIYHDTGESDPHRLAAKVLDALPESMYRVVLEALIPKYIIDHFLQPNRAPAPADEGVGPSPHPSLPGRNHQALVQRVAHGWLAGSGLGADGYKRLADFTLADCQFAADSRRKRAADVAAQADWFDRLAAALEAAEACRLSDLPDTVLDEVAP